MTAIAYAKWIGIAALIAAIAAFSFRQGGLASEAKLAKYQTEVQQQHAQDLQAVLNTMKEHDNQAAAALAEQQKVIDAYDAEKNLAPVTTGIVQRMRIVESATCSAGDSKLPPPPVLAGGAQARSGIPRGDAEGDRLLQAALDAADRDAERLNTLIKLAPP